jgi:TolB-like protein
MVVVEGLIMKNLLLFCAFLLTANILFAGGRAERKIEKTDINVIPQTGESEIFFDLQSGESAYIYIDRRFVAQCYKRDDTDAANSWLEKVIVKNGRHTIEVSAVTLRYGSKTRLADAVTDRKTLECNAESESITVGISMNQVNGDYKIADVFYADRQSLTRKTDMPLNQTTDGRQSAAEPRITVAVAPFEEKTGIIKSDADAITEIFTAELLASKSVRIVTRANLDKVMSEMQFQMGDWSNDEKTAKLGEATNADWVVRGQVTKLGSRVIVTANSLDVKTLEMTGSARMQMSNIEDAYDQMESFVGGMIQTMTGKN